MFCSNCGKPINNTPFCSNCGAPAMVPPQPADVASQAQSPISAQPEPVAAAAPEIAPAPEPIAAVPILEQAQPQAPVQQAQPDAVGATVPVQPQVQAPVQQPVQPQVQAPIQQPVQAQVQAPVQQPVQAQPQPQMQNAQVQVGSGIPAQQPKKKSKAPFIVLGVVGGVILLAGGAVAAVLGLQHQAKVQKYDSAKEAFENKEYERAIEEFGELEDYEDASYYVEYAKVELDSEKIDGLVASKDFDGAIKILKERSEFFGKDDEGEKAEKLIDEYTTAKAAFDALDSKDYSKALSKFNSLSIIGSDYNYEKDLCQVYCDAYQAKEENNWFGIVANLYAIQTQDLALNFLANPATEEDKVIADAYNNQSGDYEAIAEILKPEGTDQQDLADYALAGMKYDKAIGVENNKKYEDAMNLFAELGDFLDAKDHYNNCKAEIERIEQLKKTYSEAEKLFNNGEYYKAMVAYKSIKGYKDADEKAAQCKQEMPANGSMKKSSGSGVTMKIQAPSDRSVLLKFYNTDGKTVAQIFIRAGKTAKLKLKAATYTIKAAYGTEWYGDIDLFGEKGIYSQLLNGSAKDFKLKNNYIYTLKLMVSSNGNVGSNTVPGGAGGM